MLARRQRDYRTFRPGREDHATAPPASACPPASPATLAAGMPRWPLHRRYSTDGACAISDPASRSCRRRCRRGQGLPGARRRRGFGARPPWPARRRRHRAGSASSACPPPLWPSRCSASTGPAPGAKSPRVHRRTRDVAVAGLDRPATRMRRRCGRAADRCRPAHARPESTRHPPRCPRRRCLPGGLSTSTRPRALCRHGWTFPDRPAAGLPLTPGGSRQAGHGLARAPAPDWSSQSGLCVSFAGASRPETVARRPSPKSSVKTTLIEFPFITGSRPRERCARARSRRSSASCPQK
jgi:hypothetical protein